MDCPIYGDTHFSYLKLAKGRYFQNFTLLKSC